MKETTAINEFVARRRRVTPVARDEAAAVWSAYPADWPPCPGCGLPAIDGHVTCGKVECDEGARR